MKSKKIKIILTSVVFMLLIFTMKSKALDFTVTPKEVYPNEEFDLKINLDGEVACFDGTLKFDETKIKILSANTDNTEVVAHEKGTASIIYLPGSEQSSLRKEISIKAKVEDITDKELSLNFTFVKAGTADNVVTIIEDKQYREVKLKVNELKEITVSSEKIEIEKGKTETIKAEGNGKLTFKSEDEKIAKVDENGKVEAIEKGETNIVITDEYGKTKSVKIIVKENSTPTNGGTTDNTNTNDKDTTKAPNHAKAGESSIILVLCIISAGALVFLAIKRKKFNKLFIMIPVLAVATTLGNYTEAATDSYRDIQLEKVDIGIYSGKLEHATKIESIKGQDAIFISPRADLHRTGNELNPKIKFGDISSFFTSNGISVTSIDGNNVSHDSIIKTGTKISVTDGQINKTYPVIFFGSVTSEGGIFDIGAFTIMKAFALHKDVGDNEANAYYRAASNVAWNIKDGNDEVFSEIINPNFDDEGLLQIDIFDLNRYRNKYWAYDGSVKMDSQELVKPENRIGRTLVNSKIDRVDSTVFFDYSTEDGAFQVNGKKYDSLVSAMDMFGKNGGTVTVVKDSNTNCQDIKINGKKQVTIDLNGHVISVTDGVTSNTTFKVARDSQLTVKGKSSTVSDMIASNARTGSNLVDLDEGAEFILLSGTLRNPMGKAIGGKGKVTIKNGVIETSAQAIEASELVIDNGNIQGGEQENLISATKSVIINGGVFTGQISTTALISKKDSGDITINEGTFILPAGATGVCVKQEGTGNININGGNFQASLGSTTTKIMQDVTNGNINIQGGEISTYKTAIYQKNGNKININNIKNDVRISQTRQGTDNDKDYVVIVKDSEGEVNIGSDNDIVSADTRLYIDAKDYGIKAPRATVNFLNGKSNEKAILSAKVINTGLRDIADDIEKGSDGRFVIGTNEDGTKNLLGAIRFKV